VTNRTPLENWPNFPALLRAGPFVVFVLFTALQGQFGEQSRYWVYALKTIVGGALIWIVWPYVREMRWSMSWDAVLAGVIVFGIWVGLDGIYPTLDTVLRQIVCPVAKHLGFEQWCASTPSPPKPWNPHAVFSPTMAWAMVLVRLAGSTLVVPPLEEAFYRSFLYRYLTRPDFQAVPLSQFRRGPFLITAAIFGLAHVEWLPGILCGIVYQGLVLRHSRLGDAMTAHAITNGLLGLWIISRGDWHFW
jgi:uncharacterized protein